MAVRMSDSAPRPGKGAPITSKQVALILARAREVNILGEASLLEWLEYGACLGQYYRIEDLPANKFQLAMEKIAEMKEQE